MNLVTLLAIKRYYQDRSDDWIYHAQGFIRHFGEDWRQFIALLILSIKMNLTGRIESSQQIFNHPANTSTAKTQWSFPKAPRFGDNPGYASTISYNLPSSASKRYSGIGYGSRSKYFDGQNVTNPSPGKYESLSDFKKTEKKGYSFGYSRDELNFSNYLKQLEKTPPAYGLNESQIKSTRAYSMRPKTAYPKNYFLPNSYEERRMKELPGPGKYQTIDMLGTSKDFYNSKHKTQHQKAFDTKQRFYQEKRTPGPGDYTITNTIQPDGICFLSNMKSSGKRSILNQKRELYLPGNKYTPGPGQYQQPSDFGHYDHPGRSGQRERPRTARH